VVNTQIGRRIHLLVGYFGDVCCKNVPPRPPRDAEEMNGMFQIIQFLCPELRSTTYKLGQSQHIAWHVNSRRNVPAALGATYDIGERSASFRVGGA
jgi:hypothetical protein